MAIDVDTYKNVAIAIANYARERWVHARLLTGTGLTAGNVEIMTSGEGFTGQLRWLQEFDAVVNQVQVGGTSTDGTITNMTTEIADYVKIVRSFGTEAPQQARLITQRDGIADFTNEFVRSQAKNEDAAIRGVINGVAAAEATRGNGGITSFDTDADSADVGAYIDLNAQGEFGASGPGTDRKLIGPGSLGGTSNSVDRLFRCVGMFWKDYEPEYLYMITTPDMFADLRGKNLVDDTTVTEGNIEFTTILNGKFRLIPSRGKMANSSTSWGNVEDASNKTTILAAPGALSFVPIAVEVPVEFDRNARAYGGGGRVDVWYRYGFIVHPNGYDWSGATDAFPSDATLGAAASWTRKAKALNLGICPIFHS